MIKENISQTDFMKTVQLPYFHPNVICQTDRNDHLTLTRSNDLHFFSSLQTGLTLLSS